MNDLVKTESAIKHLQKIKDIIQNIEQLDKSNDIGKRDSEINGLLKELIKFIDRKEELDQNYSKQTLLTIGLVHMIKSKTSTKEKEISFKKVYSHIDRGLSD